MSLKFNPNDARKADQFNSVIRETGQYVGTITRAQKLSSKQNTQGLGLSLKADDGSTANYLDVYTQRANGEKLRGDAIVQALMCCLKLREAPEGPITFEKWDFESGGMVKVTDVGYPAIMGKRIGLVLQRELGTNSNTGGDTDRVNIVAVFDADTKLMASEILDKKTTPEKLQKVVAMVMANPIRDTRKRTPARTAAVASGGGASMPPTSESFFDDDIPF